MQGIDASTLIIDDEVELLAGWTRRARNRGFEVVTASTWDEGIGLFYVLSPDLVIADYNLPGSSNGLRLLAEIRRLRPSVRLVLISGAVDPGKLEQAEQLDFIDRVILKGAHAADVVLEEIERAASQSSTSTDWQAFASAYRVAESVTDAEIDLVDAILNTSIEMNSET